MRVVRTHVCFTSNVRRCVQDVVDVRSKLSWEIGISSVLVADATRFAKEKSSGSFRMIVTKSSLMRRLLFRIAFRKLQPGAAFEILHEFVRLFSRVPKEPVGASMG